MSRVEATPKAKAATAAGKSAGLGGVARGSSLNLGGAAIAALAVTAVTVLVTHHFNRYIAGSFFTATSAYVIVSTVASLGASTGLVYFIARLRTLGEERRIPALLRAAVIPTILVSTAMGAAMVVFAGPLAHFLLSDHTGKNGTVGIVTNALRGLGVLVPFGAMETVLLGISRGYRQMMPTVIVDRIGVNVGALIVVLAAMAGGITAFLAPLWALPYVPAVAVAWIWTRRIRRNPTAHPPTLPDVPPELGALLALATPVPSPYGTPARRPPAVSGRVAAKRLANATPAGFWRYTAPRGLANLAQTIVQRLDIVLVAIIRGPVDAAIYTAATRFLVLGQFGNAAISTASQPRLAELFAADDKPGTNIVYQFTTAWLVLLNWPLYLLSMVFGPQVLELFGKAYTAGDMVMVVLGFSMIFGTAVGQVDIVLITAGRSTWSLLNAVLVMVVNVSLDLILIPRHGIIGAAIGWAAAVVVANLVPLIQLAVVYKLHPFGRAMMTACVLTGLTFGLVPLAFRLVIGGWAALGAGVLTACLLQAAGLWLFRGTLRLNTMPGMSSLKKRLTRGAPRPYHG
jgi:O-antigen/teichoic acid export membrane protein